MKLILLFVIIISFTNNSFLRANEIYVVTKVNNKIITNADIKNEYKYLVALSPGLEDVKKNEVMKLAKKSIIKEKIKEDEIIKFFDINVENKMMSKIIADFYKQLGMQNENEFKIYLAKYGLDYNDVKKKISIETAWNDLVYKRFSKKVEIDEKEIKDKIKNLISNSEEQIVYSISEIFFSAEDYEDLKIKYEKINESIIEIGFEKSAAMYGTSNSAKNGGKIGWVTESQLNEIIKDKIINLEVGKHTNPITIPGGFLIIKLDNRKKEKLEIDFDKDFKKQMIKERNLQLEQFSKTYFKKIKKNSSISEK